MNDFDNEDKLCECGCNQSVPIAKKTNTAKGHIKGQSIRFVNGHQNRRPIEERFWEKVDKQGDNDCWNWQAYVTPRGYGRLSIGSMMIRAHRFSYELHCGEIPEEMHVLHSCDNPSCVNPAHLFLGTNQDNVDDRTAKEREARGIKNGNAKLTPEKVRCVRILYKDGATQVDIADRFDVGTTTISNIIRGETWRHIE